MIPAIQRGDPQWSELRAMGIGWWVRNVNTLRRCIEKVTFFHWILKDCHFPFFLILSLLNSRSLFVWSLLRICTHTLFLLSSVFISLPIKAPIPGFFSFPLQNTYTFLFPLLLLYPSCFFFFLNTGCYVAQSLFLPLLANIFKIVLKIKNNLNLKTF